MEDLQLFSQNIKQEVITRAIEVSDGALHADTFTEIVLEEFQNAGDFEDATVCVHQSTGSHGSIHQMSGYGISENGEHLDLFITVFSSEDTPDNLTSTEAKKYFERLIRVFNDAKKGAYAELEESSPAFDAYQSIWRVAHLEKSLLTIRLVLVTNRIMTGKPPQDMDVDYRRINFDVIDLERLYRLRSSGVGREKIEFDFIESIGNAIPCLVQPDSTEQYSSYLAIFPGTALAKLYGKYGSRLLERNVRAFLQARGKINRGIRDTIIAEPQMFLAFNNGLSITAESVDTVTLASGGTGIKSIRDLQIVNGGQTTASIFHAAKREKKAEIERVFVQVKITVLSDLSRMDEVIPRISRYANSQNSIQAADLVANDKFHREIEELSRTTWAPAKDGTIRQKRWYYERARGQYADEIARLQTVSEIKAFQDAHPKEQVFTKTDLAQFLMTWEQKPYLVSRGGQKCLVAFMGQLESHLSSEGQPNNLYFQRLIAKALLFRGTRSLVENRKSIFTAYRANIVTYTIARLVFETNSALDLDKIWREQSISSELQVAILDLAESTRTFLLHKNEGQNITEFCKKEATWSNFLIEQVYTNSGFQRFAASSTSKTRSTSTANSVHSLALQKSKVMSITPSTLFEIVEWGRKSKKLNHLQCAILIEIATKRSGLQELSPSEVKDTINILKLTPHFTDL